METVTLLFANDELVEEHHENGEQEMKYTPSVKTELDDDDNSMEVEMVDEFLASSSSDVVPTNVMQSNETDVLERSAMAEEDTQDTMNSFDDDEDDADWTYETPKPKKRGPKPGRGRPRKTKQKQRRKRDSSPGVIREPKKRGRKPKPKPEQGEPSKVVRRGRKKATTIDANEENTSQAGEEKETRRKKRSEGLTPEQREALKAKWREEARLKRQRQRERMTPEERAVFLEKQREQTRKRRQDRSEQEKDEKREIARLQKRYRRSLLTPEQRKEEIQKVALRRIIRKATMTDEEKEALRVKTYMATVARLSSLTSEERERRRQRKLDYQKTRNAVMSEDMKEKKKEAQKRYRQNLPPEKREKFLESLRKCYRSRIEKLKDDPEKWEEVRAKWKENNLRRREAMKSGGVVYKRKRGDGTTKRRGGRSACLPGETSEERAERLRKAKRTSDKKRKLQKKLTIQNLLDTGLTMEEIQRKIETSEQRERRLMKARVNKAKNNLRKKLVEAKASPDEIEKKLDELVTTYQPTRNFRPYKPRPDNWKPLEASDLALLQTKTEPTEMELILESEEPASSIVTSPTSNLHAHTWAHGQQSIITLLPNQSVITITPQPNQQFQYQFQYETVIAEAETQPIISSQESTQTIHYHNPTIPTTSQSSTTTSLFPLTIFDTMTPFADAPQTFQSEYTIYSHETSPPPPTPPPQFTEADSDGGGGDDGPLSPSTTYKKTTKTGRVYRSRPGPKNGPRGPKNTKKPVVRDVICDLCGNAYNSNYIRDHKNEHHNPNWVDGKCAICGLEFTVGRQFYRHYRIAHLGQNKRPRSGPRGPKQSGRFANAKRDVVCEICGNAYTRAYINEHKKEHHNPNWVDGKCITCGLEFSVGRLFWRHYRSEHLEKLEPDQKYICSQCGAGFRQAEYLKNHEFYSHGEGARVENYKECTVCHKKFKMNITLTAHMRRMHDPSYKSSMSVRYDCIRCAERFHDGSTLNEHVKEHHPEAYFPCPHCHILKYTEAGLNFHFMRCPKRPEGFLQENRETQNKTSIERIPLPCSICGKMIALFSLTRHYLDIHGVKEDHFKCCSCDRKFKRRDFWVAHMEMVHGTELEEVVDQVKRLNVEDLGKVDIRNPEGPRGFRKSREKKVKPVKSPKKRGPGRKKTKNEVKEEEQRSGGESSGESENEREYVTRATRTRSGRLSGRRGMKKLAEDEVGGVASEEAEGEVERHEPNVPGVSRLPPQESHLEKLEKELKHIVIPIMPNMTEEEITNLVKSEILTEDEGEEFEECNIFP